MFAGQGGVELTLLVGPAGEAGDPDCVTSTAVNATFVWRLKKRSKRQSGSTASKGRSGAPSATWLDVFLWLQWET
jgi:hypothetical protein